MQGNRFTVSLALTDAVPVIFFGIAAGALGTKLHSAMFMTGAAVCLLAGLGKVIWKMVLALGGPDIAWLGAQLRYVMPVGFVLMIAGAVLSDRMAVRGVLQSAVRMPSVLFFALALCGLAGMFVCAKRYDRRDVKGNWIEQGINLLAQACVMIGVLMLG